MVANLPKTIPPSLNFRFGQVGGVRPLTPAPSQPSLHRMDATEPSKGSISVDPLAGHLGHLSDEQEAKFVEFRAACEKDGVYNPGTGRASLNETTLLCVHP